MGNATSSSDSEEDHHTDYKDDDTMSEADMDLDRDAPQSIDLQTLFDHMSLRAAAAKVKDDMPENVVQQQHDHLISWLEERQKRIEDTVTLAQFCDVLMSRSVGREDCIQAFQQFDSEGDGTADVAAMLEALKGSNSANVYGELGYVVRTLQACSLTPGFIDVYNEDKQTIGKHGTRILNFLLRNRAPSSSLPFPTLSGFNNTVNMRLTIVRSHFAKMKDTASRNQEAASLLSNGEELKPITRCYKSIEVSTNKTDADRLTNGEFASFWQSDGSARSHWIRLRMRHNVVIKQLSVVVAASDQSYMPQQIAVAVGKNVHSLREIKDVRIPAHISGDVILLENVKTFYPVIQINIKRCHSDGCDTRIHEVKTLGYRIMKESSVSVMDASASWFLQVLAATATTSIPAAPALCSNILQHTKGALRHMPPLSLSSASSERPQVLSAYVLKEVDKFISDIVSSGNDDVMDGLYVLLSFNLACGNVAGTLTALRKLQESGDETSLEAGSLLQSLHTVRNTFWKRQGGLLNLTLAGCDGGQKEDASGPQNVLNVNWTTTQAYLSGDGKTRVNLFFKAPEHVQLTKVRIKVDRGPRGPKCGMIFVYKERGEFDLEKQVEYFKQYDTWTAETFSLANKDWSASIGLERKVDTDRTPRAFFSLEDDWDEVEIMLDSCPIGQYVLIKFLEPRQNSAERLGIVGIKFHGFLRKSIFVHHLEMERQYQVTDSCDSTSTDLVLFWTFNFLVSLARDHVPQKSGSVCSKAQSLDMTDMSFDLIWQLYSNSNNRLHQNLILQLLHSLFPVFVDTASKHTTTSAILFKHLCQLVDHPPFDVVQDDHLMAVVKQVIVDGAAVFFPDKDARRKQLFNMMTDINGMAEAPSVSLVFQSLCQFFSSVDPSGLLDLPQTLDKHFVAEPVLAVMDTMVSVASREFMKIVDTAEVTQQASHLGQLLCSLQTALLCWCHHQICSENRDHSATAQDVLIRYVSLLGTRAIKAVQDLQTKPAEHINSVMSKLEMSFLASAVRQMVLIIMLLCDQLSSSTRVSLLKSLMPLAQELRKVGLMLPGLFYKVESEHWKQMEGGEVVLRTWEIESPHNYENNQHTIQIFSCPGASTFEVEFDPRCETEKRYDYLEFTDSQGSKTRYDQKVGSEKWQASVTFKGGYRLQFLFHSDGSNNEWGYKFKVTAKGTPDVPLCWMFDLKLGIAKLLGQLCGASVDTRLVSPKKPMVDGPDDPEAELLHSDLWTTLFRGGYRVGKLQRSFSGKHVALDESKVANLLWGMVDKEEGNSAVFLSRCRQQCKAPRVGGEELDDTVTAVFSSLLWHTQTLREEVDKMDFSNCEETKIADGIFHAYNVADSVRLYLLEQKQKLKLAAEKSGSTEEVLNPVTACKEKALFLLKFAGLQRVHIKAESSKGKLSRQTSRFVRIQGADKGFKLENIMEKYPSFRLVLEFVRDPAWSKDRVEELLKERSVQAWATAEVYMFAAEYVRIMANQHIFQVPTVLFLQQMLSYQAGFPRHYADGLDGCGLVLEAHVRQAYYTLIRRLVESVRAVERSQLPRPVMGAFDYIEACMLHLLDFIWQLYDLSFLVEVKMPELYMSLAKGSVSIREKMISEPNPAQELEVFRKDMEWLEECKKGFINWYNRSSKGSKSEKKAMQMFVAKFCDLLEVEINCDGCGVMLPGRRYRCLQCHDMDLCATCYAGGVKPAGDHTDEHEIVHMMYKCDECQAFIVGTRIHCKVCDDFDLCYGCHKKGVFPAGHDAAHGVDEHPMIKLKLSKETDTALQSYLHQHVWLLFASLSLSMAALMYNSSGRRTADFHVDYIKPCTELHNMSLQLGTKCLMQVNVSADDQDEVETREAQALRQEEAFAFHAQERIMGLLGAMIPPENKTPISEEVNYIFTSERFLLLLFTIARGETGHEANTQHLAMGLVGQLLQRTTTSCAIVDTAVAMATKNPIPQNAPEGAHTAEFLFSFGATCWERSGLEWANSMASILQKLFNSAAWRDVLLNHLTSSIQRLKQVSSSDISIDVSHEVTDCERFEALFKAADTDSDGYITEVDFQAALTVKYNHIKWTSFWLLSKRVQMCYAHMAVGASVSARKLCDKDGTKRLTLEQFSFLMTLLEKRYGKLVPSMPGDPTVSSPAETSAVARVGMSSGSEPAETSADRGSPSEVKAQVDTPTVGRVGESSGSEPAETSADRGGPSEVKAQVDTPTVGRVGESSGSHAAAGEGTKANVGTDVRTSRGESQTGGEEQREPLRAEALPGETKAVPSDGIKDLLENDTKAVPSEGTKDLLQNDTKAVPSEGTKAVASEGTKDLLENDTKAVPSEGTKAVPSEGTKDLLQNDPKAVPSEGTKDLLEHDTKAVASEGTKDLLENDTKAVPSEGTKAVASEGTKDLLENDTKAVPSEGTKAVASEGTKDLLQNDTKAVPSEGTKDLLENDTKAVPSEGTKDLLQNDTKAVASEGMKAVASEGTKDLLQNDTKAVPSEGTKAVASEGTKDLLENDTKAVPSEGTKAVPSEGTKDLLQNDPKAVPSEGTKDLLEHDTKAVPSEGTKDLLENDTKAVASEGIKDLLEHDTKAVPSEGTKDLLENDTKAVASEGIKDLLEHDTKAVPSEGTKAVTSEGTKDLLENDTKAVASEGTKAVPSEGMKDLLENDTKAVPSDGTKNLLDTKTSSSDGVKSTPENPPGGGSESADPQTPESSHADPTTSRETSTGAADKITSSALGPKVKDTPNVRLPGDVGPELSSIFALFVIAGFPEVLSIGAQVEYTEISTDVKKGVVLKHFPDKNQTLLVDRKSRRRKLKKDDNVECVAQEIQVLDQQHVSAFIEVIKDITTNVKQGACVSVENMWVLSLGLKALYKSLECGRNQRTPELFTQDFVQCIVHLASQGTGFSKQWLLKDLEVLSLMLYTRDQEKQEETKDSSEEIKSPTEESTTSGEDSGDPWEGLDETATHCFRTLNEHLGVNVAVLRAMYDLHEGNTSPLYMTVQENFVPSEEVRRLAKKWAGGPSIVKVVEKSVDMGMQPVLLHPQTHKTFREAVEEPSEESQRLISTSDSDVSSDAVKQRRTKSSALLKKELDSQGKTGSREFLLKVNMAMAVLYARHVLMSLLADWPADGQVITAQLIGCQDDSHVPFILDLLNRSDTQETFQKVVRNVISCCSLDCIAPIAMAACQFLEEVNLSTITKESEHDYKNNSKLEDKITIPGVSYLSIKFDNRCCTEENCDELVMAGSADYCQFKHTFSGSKERWIDFDMPGDTLYFRFESDGSNNDWGYKFTVTGGKLGRFDTGYMILNSIFSMSHITKSLNVAELWLSLVYVACKQSGQQRLKALQLALKILLTQFKSAGCESLQVDLGLLKPLWLLYNNMADATPDSCSVIPPVVRALTEVFLVAENIAMEWNITNDYMLALVLERDIQKVVFQGLQNIAALSLSIGVVNKATEAFASLEETKPSKKDSKDSNKKDN